MSLATKLKTIALGFLVGLVATLGVASITPVFANAAPIADITPEGDGHPYRPLFALADTTDAGVTIPPPPADETAAGPSMPTTPDLLQSLSELQAKYEAVKAARKAEDKSAIMLVYAAGLAALLKVLLSLVGKINSARPRKYLVWIALGITVPIALLSHYALGNGWFDSLVYAGAGPGAIVAHEAWKALTKPKAKA